jgi:hypothetical protein
LPEKLTLTTVRITHSGSKARDFLRDPEALLQLLYDVNLIGYAESVTGRGTDARADDTFFHWSYREKSLNNIAPKVKAAEVLILNPGIAKALDIGKSAAPRPPRSASKRKRRRGKKGGRN